MYITYICTYLYIQTYIYAITDERIKPLEMLILLSNIDGKSFWPANASVPSREMIRVSRQILVLNKILILIQSKQQIRIESMCVCVCVCVSVRERERRLRKSYLRIFKIPMSFLDRFEWTDSAPLIARAVMEGWGGECLMYACIPLIYWDDLVYWQLNNNNTPSSLYVSKSFYQWMYSLPLSFYLSIYFIICPVSIYLLIHLSVLHP